MGFSAAKETFWHFDIWMILLKYPTANLVLPIIVPRKHRNTVSIKSEVFWIKKEWISCKRLKGPSESQWRKTFRCFLYSFILTEYVAIEPRVCVCVSVCASVRLCVCVCHLYSPNKWTDFDETLHKWSLGYLRVSFFAVFEISNLMTS